MRTITFVLFVVVVLSYSAAVATMQLPGRVVAVEQVTPIIDQPTAVYHVGRAAQRPVLDGKADEWQGVPAIVLDRKEQSGGKWNTAADLSGKLRLQWDAEQLYFCAEVTDDIHAAPSGEKDFWLNDDIQFAFDAYMNGPRGGYDSDELNMLVSDSPKGPQMVSYRQRGQVKDTEAVIPDQRVAMSVQPGGTVVYEWAIPWARLAPVSPTLLGRCGFSVVFSDNDGTGYESSLMWTPGIAWGQDASRFGQLIFDGAVGTADAVLPLHPETRFFTDDTRSQWMTLPGIDGRGIARVLVRPAKGGPVAARVDVYRNGKRTAEASGAVTFTATAGKMLAFAWDLSPLPTGEYEVMFSTPSLPAVPAQRFPYRHYNAAQLHMRIADVKERFALDRPWDDISSASPLIRRHRGLVALLMQCVTGDDWICNRATFMTPEQAADILVALNAGKDYLAAQRNEFNAAYFSPADGSGQPFVVTLPKNFSPKKTYPLIVSLHGSSGRPMARSAKTQFDTHILVQPWGRGDNTYRGLGEDDVLRVLADMRQWYRIDPARIYLTGGSMGGYGTWILGSKYPDFFAAAAPVYGGPDDAPLANLRNVPVFNQHGQTDMVVPINGSRFAVSAMQKMGYVVLHKEFPGIGHQSIPEFAAKNDWLLNFRRVAHPKAVTLTCETRAYGKAYWVNIRRFEDDHRRAHVQARVEQSEKTQALTLLLDNVAVLECAVAGMPVNPKGELRVLINGEYREVAAPLPERLVILRQDGKWTIADHWTAPTSAIRPYYPGAAANIYGGEPLLIVYGTQGPKERNEVLQSAAEKLAVFAGAGGRPMPIGRIPVKADREVTAEDIAHRNLILLGGARDNVVTARMAALLPFTINAKNELLAGNREPVSLDGAGFCLAYYNPLAPDRLIHLVATEMNTEDAKAWLSYPQNLLIGSGGWARGDQPDLIVRALDGAARRLMQFTEGWQWRKLDGAEIRLPAAMAMGNNVTAAGLRVMRRVSRADFIFDWGDPKNPRWNDPQYFTLADMATASAPRQLMLARMTGEALRAFYTKTVAKGDAIALPATLPADLDPQRLYHVALPPDFCWLFMKSECELLDVQAAPDWRAEDAWDEVFGR